MVSCLIAQIPINLHLSETLWVEFSIISCDNPGALNMILVKLARDLARPKTPNFGSLLAGSWDPLNFRKIGRLVEAPQIKPIICGYPGH